MIVTHTKVSAIGDGGDSNLIRPSDWNASHTLSNVFRGALVHINAPQVISNITLTAVNWDLEVYDTDSIHESITYPSRLTVPAGVTFVKLVGNIYWADNSTGFRYFVIYKNGDLFNGSPILRCPATGTSEGNICSPVVAVTGGNYFTLVVYQSSGGNLNVVNYQGTWFAMEIIQ